MDCSTFREALSARLDGETGPVPDEALDRHLLRCPDCRAWDERITGLRRGMLVREAPPVPDLTERITAAARPKRGRLLRGALGVVAVAQSGLGIAQLLGAAGVHGAHSTHLSNESAAWNLAIGIGLLWAALRPRAAGGQLPAFAGFTLIIGAVSAADLLGGHVTAGRVFSHVLVAIGVGLLIAVHRRLGRDPHPTPSTADDRDTPDLPKPDLPDPAHPAAPHRAPHRRTGHQGHHAA
ncbi:zf-HC2 domain-containing protein [Saccharopolyspora cebuensis]|uniref:Zf-HC2 domain-containing protein n=1 Tax=Saccharopolyspora cebuensis TaxID=418759 RepID=A0ABV4CKH2_9PSEU